MGINKKKNNSNNAGGGIKVTEMRYRAIVKPAQIPVKKTVNDSRKDKENNKEDSINRTKDKTKEKVEKGGMKEKDGRSGKIWNLSPENKEALKHSANKYAILQNEEDNEYVNEFPILLSPQKKQIVEKYICERCKPTDEEFKQWSNEMRTYFKENRRRMKQNVLFEEGSRVLETHIKENNVSKICDKVFDKWEWVSNAKFSPSSCRINIGNDGKNIRELWKELETQSLFANGKPSCLMGDFNVTLKIDEHSEGMSCCSTDMIEF
ncbi:hypothetical protein Tco_0683600 [Tanacetum coccineum]